jgi:hypothetical protein
MLNFKFFLYERKEFGEIKKIYNSLSIKTQDAIEKWEFSDWVAGNLVKSYKSNSEIAKELDYAFEPIRKILKKKYGNNIKLYRGIILTPGLVLEKRVLESWTSEKKVAEAFAGLRLPDHKAG